MAGEILKVTEKHPGGWSHDETTPEPDKLSDIGITKSQSHRWQAIAEIPEPVFEEHITKTKERGELTDHKENSNA